MLESVDVLLGAYVSGAGPHAGLCGPCVGGGWLRRLLRRAPIRLSDRPADLPSRS